jgi:proteasome lid subunit RPN8/RPN11
MLKPIEIVLLTESLMHRWIEDCRSLLPNEACGVVCGRVAETQVWVDDFVFVRNAAPDKSTSFRFDPADWVRVWYTVQHRHPIIGIFHTHPHGDPTPSDADRLGLTAWGTQWIVALDKQKSRIAVYRPDPESGWQTLRLQTI